MLSEGMAKDIPGVTFNEFIPMTSPSLKPQTESIILKRTAMNEQLPWDTQGTMITGCTGFNLIIKSNREYWGHYLNKYNVRCLYVHSYTYIPLVKPYQLEIQLFLLILLHCLIPVLWCICAMLFTYYKYPLCTMNGNIFLLQSQMHAWAWGSFKNTCCVFLYKDQ